MKLIIVIVQDSDSSPVSKALTEAGFRVTLIASTGGFLRSGNSTLLIGTDGDKVETAIQIIADSCAPPEEPGMKRATLFVLDIDHYEQI